MRLSCVGRTQICPFCTQTYSTYSGGPPPRSCRHIPSAVRNRPAGQQPYTAPLSQSHCWTRLVTVSLWITSRCKVSSVSHGEFPTSFSVQSPISEYKDQVTLHCESHELRGFMLFEELDQRQFSLQGSAGQTYIRGCCTRTLRTGFRPHERLIR